MHVAHCDKDHFNIWADNCTAQNKNWWLYTALVSEVNHLAGPLSITIKYFEPGHTFMSADSFHHQIELLMKKKKRVDNFADFKSIINQRGIAIDIDYSDFFNYPRGVSQGKFADSKPKLKDIQVVKFLKGSKHIYWKTSFSGGSNSAPFFRKTRFHN